MFRVANCPLSRWTDLWHLWCLGWGVFGRRKPEELLQCKGGAYLIDHYQLRNFNCMACLGKTAESWVYVNWIEWYSLALRLFNIFFVHKRACLSSWPDLKNYYFFNVSLSVSYIDIGTVLQCMFFWGCMTRNWRRVDCSVQGKMFVANGCTHWYCYKHLNQ